MDTPVEKIDVTAGMKFGCLQVLDEGAEYLQVMDERISNIKEEKAEFVGKQFFELCCTCYGVTPKIYDLNE